MSSGRAPLLPLLHLPCPLRRDAIGVTGAIGGPNKKGVLAGLHLVRGARATGLPLLLVELAAEVRASLGGGKPESDLDHRLHCAHDLLRVLGDFRLRRASVDRERALGRARVDVSDLILGAYVEAVGAVGEPRVALWRRAGGPGTRVETALEAGTGLRREAEGSVLRPHEPGGPGCDLSVRSGRVDAEGARGRARVDVCGRVDRPHTEGVGAVCKRSERARRRTGAHRAAVDGALKG